MKPTLITCYVNPDLDGYAGIVAYTELLKKTGKNVVAGIIGEPHDEVKYVLDRFNLERVEVIPDDELFDEVILIDASEINGLKGRVTPGKVVEIIDHRKINEADKFVNAKVQIELVGAAATLVAEKFKQNNISISKESAILLYSAIISNTLNFKGGVTTTRDKELFEWLRQFIEVPDDYWKELFTAKSDLSGDLLSSRMEGDIAGFIFNGIKISIAQLEIIGSEQLVEERKEEMVDILHTIEKDLNLDLIFLNIIDLELAKNYFITDNDKTKILLKEAIGVEFGGVVAEREQLIMRKQIVPLIKKVLEK